MAASHSSFDCQHVDGSIERTNLLYMTESSDQPFDVTLVVKNGKQFKAHGNILSKASSFFERILYSDLKESREGVIRLEVLNEEIMEDILEFIYSGSVSVCSMERAEDLIAAADYLFLQNLKIVAGRFLEESLTTSNHNTVYEFAKRYRCFELMNNINKFIHLNFVSVANEEHFLNLPSHEVEQLISSDDIHVTAEDDVFKIILKWINHDINERKKNFQDLFRHVRLDFASRDCLCNEMLTNNFVKQNEVCLNSVNFTLNHMWYPLFYRKPYDVYDQLPRTVLHPEVLVACGKTDGTVWIYLPEDDIWYNLPDVNKALCYAVLRRICYDCLEYHPHWLLSAQNKLIAISLEKHELLLRENFRSAGYDPFLNIWTWFPYCMSGLGRQFESWENPDIITLTVVEEEIFVLVYPNSSTRDTTILLRRNQGLHRGLDSWQTVPSFDWGPKKDVCVVSWGKYLYAVGGQLISEHGTCLAEAARFNTIEDKWETIADIQEARHSAFGAAAGEKVFIAGGYASVGTETCMSQACEMYNVSTNEWQFIADLTLPRASASMVCVQGQLYVLGGLVSSLGRSVVECYDSEKNEWKKRTVVPFPLSRGRLIKNACSMRIFKGSLSNLLSVRPEHVPRPCNHPVDICSSPPMEDIKKVKKRRCSLM